MLIFCLRISKVNKITNFLSFNVVFFGHGFVIRCGNVLLQGAKTVIDYFNMQINAND